GHEDIDVIDLHQTKLPDGAPEVLNGNGTPRPRAIEALGSQGDTASLTQGKIVMKHFRNSILYACHSIPVYKCCDCQRVWIKLCNRRVRRMPFCASCGSPVEGR